MRRKGSPLILIIGLLALTQAFCCSTAGGNSCIPPKQSHTGTPSPSHNPQSTLLAPTTAIQTAGPSSTPNPESTGFTPTATASLTPVGSQSSSFLPKQHTTIGPAKFDRLKIVQLQDVQISLSPDNIEVTRK